MTDDERDEMEGRAMVLVLVTLLICAIIVTAAGQISYKWGYYEGLATGAKVLPVEDGKK